MIIGKWNKSVILSYIGLMFSITSVYLVIKGIDIKYSLVCLIVAGVCDLFDGTVARMCKRTEEEKNFGIELDSLIDVFNFIAVPIVLFISLKLVTIYHLVLYFIYAITGIARLAYFNITTEDNNKSVKYYTGLPVTFAALLFPIFYLLSYKINTNIFEILYAILMLIISILYIVKIKIPKPGLKVSIGLLILAIAVSCIYLFVV
jgi:CDP-diacylglycerol--serine O-phosphatidyltransferase